MMRPVIRDEKANMIALAVRTAPRAEETPVRRETTTKMLSGTRKRDESCKLCEWSEYEKGKTQPEDKNVGFNSLLLYVRWR
jgi:hypothetical protein